MLLSVKDIKRELIKGNNIAIHPLKVENIKQSSINLTASKLAWKTSDNKSAVEGNLIKIPKNETVCIYTNEAVWVSRRIGGTYHPRVSLVTRGLAHISTTLDPAWYGLSLVAVNNPTNKDIEIRVGEAFVSIMLHYLKTPSPLNIVENSPSRSDLSSKFQKNHQEEEYLQESWHKTQQGILDKMIASESYRVLEKQKFKFRRSFRSFINSSIVSAVIGGLIVGIILFLFGIN